MTKGQGQEESHQQENGNEWSEPGPEYYRYPETVFRRAASNGVSRAQTTLGRKRRGG